MQIAESVPVFKIDEVYINASMTSPQHRTKLPLSKPPSPPSFPKMTTDLFTASSASACSA